MNSWFVVHTQPNGEQKAVFHLLRQGFATYLPRYLRRRKHARQTTWVPRPLFPRYLFVSLDLAHARWRSINSTVGVSHLICEGPHPVAMPEGIVEEIRARENEQGMIPIQTATTFRPGQPIQITNGAFDSYTGLFECASEHERVTVLLELLGRQVRVRVPLEDIKAVA